jgi:glutamate-5-semialdehyde dehydrogenase
MNEIGRRAKVASRQLARAKTDQKNQTLLMLADQLIAQRESILRENVKDVEAATAAGLAPALIDRLTLNESRLNGVAADVRRVASLPDPIGEQFDHATLPNGLKLHKQRVPLGVMGVIYESRPNVTIDVTALAIKTGNAAILRGGSETLNTNRALINVVHHALESNQLPVTAIQFVDDPDRARVTELLALHDYVDVIIPRGGAALHQFCRENSRITVITGGIGICHLFVDESADLEKAVEVIHNAKTQRPSVCNALDVVLVHRAVAADVLPRVVARLTADGVTFRAEPRAISYLQSPISNLQLANETDFDTEWLSLVLSLKVVDDLDEAMDHIAQHSTAHSDGILTRDDEHANRFIAEVDSAAVYVNASTRFTDGGEFGLGAEVAVSTQRLHARGPMGLRELTTYKWVGVGDYHIRK